MSARNYATRMSCFSLITSIETDLRNVIAQEFPESEVDDVLPSDVMQTSKERYFEDKKEMFLKDDSLIDLLDFIDFYDLSKILNKTRSVQKVFSTDDVKYISTELERLTKCRNRVCHSRPLEPNDFNDLLDFTYDLLNKGLRTYWKNIDEAIKNLDNPSFALSLEIPDFWKSDKKSIYNNLPLPEFDDTGFMGRVSDRKSISKLLTSNTKVISIVGEGGIGKTALAQRCLYDILEICEQKYEDESLYDIVVWVSLKTSRLTINGVNQIRDAISSSSGLFQNVSEVLGAGKIMNLELALDEISEYMSEFKVLLCIDNLETISGAEVREFLANIPNQSKVLITTRIGLGEIEYRYKLDKLDDKPSVELMRNMSRLLNLDSLYKKKNESLKQLCKRLYNNPLLIKWYVLAMAAGKDSADLLNKQSATFQDVLKYCFENLYDQLGVVETKAISVIACMHKPVSSVELRFFLSDTPEIEIEEALHQLHNSSMLVSNIDRVGQEGRLFSLTGVAGEYINSVRPVTNEIYNLVKSKRRELQSIFDNDNVMKNHYEYDLNVVSWSTRDEKICSIYLKKALAESKKGNSEIAEEHIRKAKSIMPGFSECYRVHSLILKYTSPFMAEVELEKAVDYAPNSSVVRYAYAQHLIHEQDFERAEIQIDIALDIDSEDISLKTCKAWILTLNGDYKNALVLYEELIPKQHTRHRKFRISTYDQASSCYLRQAEQYSRDGDFRETKKCIENSLNVIEKAISNGDYDTGTINKLCKVLTHAEHFYLKTKDSSLTLAVFVVIDRYLTVFTVQSMQSLNTGLTKYVAMCDEENKYKANEIMCFIAPKYDSDKSDRIFGTVDNVVDTGRGVSYGFINGVDNGRYFFHRSELNPNNFLDEEYRDKNVIFSVGTNDRGTCAQDIVERI